MKLTNKVLINELLLVMKKKEDLRPKLTDMDFYKHKYHSERVKSDVTVRWTKFNDVLVISVCKSILTGKYDHATLSKHVGTENYGYAKEYRGLGNGFYADIDEEGRIIRSEWD